MKHLKNETLRQTLTGQVTPKFTIKASASAKKNGKAPIVRKSGSR